MDTNAVHIRIKYLSKDIDDIYLASYIIKEFEDF